MSHRRIGSVRASLPVFIAALAMAPAWGQLNDQTQTPNAAGAGILKSLSQQVGASRGDLMTPTSSVFLIKRDPFRSIRRGRQIFQRKFTLAQGLGPRTNDGVGNIETDGSHGAGLSDSCASCHGRPRGSAGVGGNVFTRPDSRDAPHLFGLGLVEMLADEITQKLRALRSQAVAAAASSNQAVTVPMISKGIRYGFLTAFPGGNVDTSGLQGVDADLRVKPFFAEGSSFSIREFAVGAFNAEMGLEGFDPDMATAAAGGVATTPSGLVLDGSLDTIPGPPTPSVASDTDGDGVVNEIDVAIVDHTEFYLLNYFKAGVHRQTNRTFMGRALFNAIGCTDCHKADLVIDHDRRVADVETVYDPAKGHFNRLFATAAPLFTEFPDTSGFASQKLPSGGSFVVRNIYADFKRHDLGPAFWEINFDGSIQKEFMTEPLWGVGSTAPYGHDGRSINLREVILRHGGEASASRNAFKSLNENRQRTVLDFLESLVLFAPDDTASNLNPGDPTDPLFPQKGHGSINLGALFNDPTEGE